MRLHRFIRDVDLSHKSMRLEDKELLNQIKNVFRLGADDKIILADGKGHEGVAEIKSFYKDGVELEVTDVVSKPISGKKPVLYLAIIKKDNFELVTQKATECGITKIIPIITDRTVKLNLNMDRLYKIALEASEQSGRSDIPEVIEPIKFADALENSKEKLNIFFDASGEPIFDILKEENSNIGAWIGPEGGWTEEEIKIAKEKGFSTASLGENTLRAETAAIVATYLISYS